MDLLSGQETVSKVCIDQTEVGGLVIFCSVVNNSQQHSNNIPTVAE